MFNRCRFLPVCKPKFTCQQCGWCCRNVVINVSHSDITRWFHEGRWDILREVSFIDNYPKKNTGGFYIVETVRNPKKPYPFLKNNSCSIHDTKPVACKDAPYGYSNFPNCPAFDEAIDDIKKHYPEVTRRQRKDFYQAFKQHRHLINLLAYVRGS